MLKPLNSAKIAESLLHSYIPIFHHSIISSSLISLIIKLHNLFEGDGQTSIQTSKQELLYQDRVPSSWDSVKMGVHQNVDSQNVDNQNVDFFKISIWRVKMSTWHVKMSILHVRMPTSLVKMTTFRTKGRRKVKMSPLSSLL